MHCQGQSLALVYPSTFHFHKTYALQLQPLHAIELSVDTWYRRQSFDQEALMILEFLPYDAGGPIWQVIHSAAANAKHNYGLDKKKLIVDQIFADEGPKIKRIRPRAQGRAYKILKPTCHITVVLKEIN